MMATRSVIKTRKDASAIHRSSCTAAQRFRLGTKQQATTNELQDHLHIENYFTASMWSMIRSSAEMMKKLKTVARFAVGTLGLHYPNDSSIASIIGVVFAAHGQPMSNEKARGYRAEFAGYIKDCRSKRLSVPGLARYPQSITEFLRAEPDRYAPGEHPVECPITSSMIESGRHLASACDGAGSRIKPPTASDKEVESIIGNRVQKYRRDTGRKDKIYTHMGVPLRLAIKASCDQKYRNAYILKDGHEHKPKGGVIDW